MREGSIRVGASRWVGAFFCFSISLFERGVIGSVYCTTWQRFGTFYLTAPTYVHLAMTPNPRCPEEAMGIKVSEMRVVDVQELCQWYGDNGRYIFALCEDTRSGVPLSRSTPITWWLGEQMPFRVLAALVAKGSAAGLIKARHMQLYDPQNREASLSLSKKMCSRYKPTEIVSSSRYVNAKRSASKRKVAAESVSAEHPYYLDVAPGDTKNPPGFELVDNFPLLKKTNVYAIDSEGNWCNAKVVSVNTANAKVHFDGWKKSYDMIHSLSSGKIRTKDEPPCKKVKVTHKVAQKLVNDHYAMYDFNGTDSDDEEVGMTWVNDDGTDNRPAIKTRVLEYVVEEDAPEEASASTSNAPYTTDFDPANEVEVEVEVEVEYGVADKELPIAAAVLASFV